MLRSPDRAALRAVLVAVDRAQASLARGGRSTRRSVVTRVEIDGPIRSS
jgi:hypothetical protein